MSWTYAELKTAISLLNPKPTTSQDIADVLNAQTRVVQHNITTSDLEKIIVPTGEAFAINLVANKTPSGSNPPTMEDQIIGAAWAFSRMLDRWETIETSDPAVWVSSQLVLGALNSAGVLSPQSITAISNVVNGTSPVWNPTVTPGDVQTAMAQQG